MTRPICIALQQKRPTLTAGRQPEVSSPAPAQALLPVFLRSLRAVSSQLDRRLVVMAMDAPALESCRKQHAYCLPWFQRTCVCGPLTCPCLGCCLSD